MSKTVDQMPVTIENSERTNASERPPLTPSEVLATKLMHSAQSWFHSQELPRATVALYLRAWTELVEKHGEERFRKSVWSVINESNFFPLPADIKRRCEELRAAQAPPVNEHVAYAAEVHANPQGYWAFGKDPDFLRLLNRCKDFKRLPKRQAHATKVPLGTPVAAGQTVDLTARLADVADYKQRAAGMYTNVSHPGTVQ